MVTGVTGAKAFIDDLRLGAPNRNILLERLRQLFKILSEYNMNINLSKCEFLKSQITYCGFVVDAFGLHKMKDKTDAIELMPQPKNKSEVRAFAGMINYYNRFIKNASILLKPLYEILRDDVPFKWTEKCESAFIAAKRAFREKVCLAFYDPKLPLVMATDASREACGGVLSHIMPDGSERPIKFISHLFN